MTSSEKFSLKWSDFLENISLTFGNLREDTTFTDVTLLSEDGHQIEAHKIILTASSPFFMNILKMNKHANPLIYLNGFKAKELIPLIDFMYHGEIEIYQDSLDEFLLKAEGLQLKGLTKEVTEVGIEERNLNGISETQYEANKIPAIHSKAIKKEIEEQYRKQEHVPNATNRIITKNISSATVSFSGGSAADLKTMLWSMISKNGTVFKCTVCGKTIDREKDKQASMHMERHVENKHSEGVTYECARCDKTFRSRNNLYKHTYFKHK